MTKMALDHLENPIFEPYKPRKHLLRQTEKSCLAFIFSICVYASVIYTLNLSPSSLFRNPKFWFFVSNTLILIIAADYGSFSGRESRMISLYEDYARRSEAARGTAPTFVSRPNEITRPTRTSPETPRVVEYFEDSAEVTKEVVYQPSEQVRPERVIRVVGRHGPGKACGFDAHSEKVKENLPKIHPANKKVHRRSKSDTTRRLMYDKRKARNVKEKNTEEEEAWGARKVIGPRNCPRSLSHRARHVGEEGDDELSELSNQELNQRAEEFIERFNREIRLEALRNRQILLS